MPRAWRVLLLCYTRKEPSRDSISPSSRTRAMPRVTSHNFSRVAWAFEQRYHGMRIGERPGMKKPASNLRLMRVSFVFTLFNSCGALPLLGSEIDWLLRCYSRSVTKGVTLPKIHRFNQSPGGSSPISPHPIPFQCSNTYFHSTILQGCNRRLQ